MELVLHYMYMVAIKDAKAWKNDTPFELSMIGLWNLIIVWLKVRLLPFSGSSSRILIFGSSFCPGAFFACGRWPMGLTRPRIWFAVFSTTTLLSVSGAVGIGVTTCGSFGVYFHDLQPLAWTYVVQRYIYIPLGGTKNAAVNTVVIFTFVALWHDLSFKLLAWGWLVSLFILPELLATYLLPASKVSYFILSQ